MKVRFPNIFYGWWVVGGSVLIAMYVAGAVFYGFTAIFEPIADELGWSYTQISLAARSVVSRWVCWLPLSGYSRTDGGHEDSSSAGQ